MLHLAKQRDTDHVSGAGEDKKFSPHACLVMFARRTAVSGLRRSEECRGKASTTCKFNLLWIQIDHKLQRAPLRYTVPLDVKTCQRTIYNFSPSWKINVICIVIYVWKKEEKGSHSRRKGGEDTSPCPFSLTLEVGDWQSGREMWDTPVKQPLSNVGVMWVTVESHSLWPEKAPTKHQHMTLLGRPEFFQP